jgi:hypothetical protein
MAARPLDLIACATEVPMAWACPGIYRLCVADPASEWFGQEYIGKSRNVRKRVMGHIWGSSPDWFHNPLIQKDQLITRVLSLFPNGISDNDLLDCEHYWITLLHPSLNKGVTLFGTKLALRLGRGSSP